MNRSRFFVYLKEKYKMTYIKIFVWYIPTNHHIYTSLEQIGYSLRFREAVVWSTGRIKANIDTNLVAEVMIDFYENNLQQSILMSCDGDFDCLVQFLYTKNIFKRLIATKPWDLSILLKKQTRGDDVTYLTDLLESHNILQKTKKNHKDPIFV